MDDVPGRFPPTPTQGPPQWNDPTQDPGTRLQGNYPMTIGRIFSLTFSLFRYRWRFFIGMSIVVMAPSWLLLSLSTALTYDMASWLTLISDLARGQAGDSVWPRLLQSMALDLIVGAVAGLGFYVATGAMTDAAATLYGGGRPTLTGSVRKSLARVGKYFLLSLIVLLATIAIVGLGAFVGVLLFTATAVDGRVTGGPAVFFGLIVFVATAVALVFVTIRWSLAIPVVVLEPLSAIGALRRSWQLVAGSSWRVLGYMFAFGFVVGIIGVIPSLVVTILLNPAQFTSVNTVAIDPGKLGLATFLSGVITAALAPIEAIGMMLLYFDLRFRRGEPVPQPGQPVPPVPVPPPA